MSSETGEPSSSGGPAAFWARVHEHKVIQWGIGYFGAALALAHGAELVTHALHWPELVWRILVLALIVGFPIALTVAWYHGHRGLQQIGAGELAIVSTLLLIGAVFFTAALRPHEDAVEAAESAERPSQSNPAPRVTDQPFLPNSVAVLPLENLSPNADNAYIAAGLHEEILNRLAKLRNLNVIARTSVLQYVGDGRPPIPEIGRALRAQSVMEGSVRYAGTRIRVTTQLVDSVTGSHLWSETYEREFGDVFAIESDIAMNVANALEAEFSVEDQQRIEQVPPVSAETYAAYLRVLPQMSSAANQGPQMLVLLDRLIADAPDFAPLHGWKAWTHSNLLINTALGSARDPAETEAQVRASAAHALALDPHQTQANSALATVDLMSWRWAEARRTYENFAKETGRTGDYHPWLSSWSGRHAEALEIAQRRVDLDPLAPAPHWYLGVVLTYAHNYDAAVASFERAIRLAPQVALFHSWLALAEIGRGNQQGAARALALTDGLIGNNRATLYLVDILYGYGRIGRSADAMRIFAEIQTIAANEEIGAGGWAMAYLAIGDRERALQQLRIGVERARNKELDQGFFSLMNIRMNVTGDPVLEQPEFAAVRAELMGD